MAEEALIKVRDDLEKTVQGRTADLAWANSAFLESKDYLYRIVDSIGDLPFARDHQRRMALMNSALCHLLGRSRKEILVKTDYDFSPPDEARVFWEKEEEALRSGRGNINQEKITNADGPTHIILTKGTLHRNNSREDSILGVIKPSISAILRYQTPPLKVTARISSAGKRV